MPNINTIETAVILQKACDQQLIEGATTGWMEANAKRYKYTGGREIKIPIISTDGLGNYDPASGYPKGKVGMSYQTKEMTQDRGVEFLLDRIEVDDSNFVATASATVSVFQTENVVPEIDAYRYSTLYQLAKAAGYGKSYTPAASTILSKLKEDITAIRDTCGGNVELVITMPYAVSDILDNNEKISKQLNVADFTQGNITTKVKTIDGVPIIAVPSARMKTAYDFHTGEDQFGFKPAAGAVQINWIVCARTAPVAASKTDNLKIFDPAVVQGADGWLIEYRKFHDLWVDDNKIKAVRVCAEPEPEQPPENTTEDDATEENSGT